jgi:FkbM family methyltransferase
MFNAAVGTARALLRPLLRRPLHQPEIMRAYSLFGSDYGSWPLLENSANESSVIYSFGIGEDISFDLAAIARYGCAVHGFDPTPKSRNWIETQPLPPQMHYYPYGISSTDGEVKFFPPANQDHVSFSFQPGKNHVCEPVICKVYRLSTIMHMLGHTAIDVLKLDVEGFEYGVIEDFLTENILPRQVLIEFHHGIYNIGNDKTKAAVDRLHESGYHIFYISNAGREYAFVRLN